jgi:hypothetical protein
MKISRYPQQECAARKPYFAAKPAIKIPRSRECKSLVLGPVQVNWYSGLRVYITWPLQAVLSR